MSKEGSENDIREGDEEAQVQENFEQHENGNKQVNGLQHDDAKCGDGVVKKQRFKWRGTECNLVDDDGVFIAKGQVATCDPQEVILDNQSGEDHVGLCIL